MLTAGVGGKAARFYHNFSQSLFLLLSFIIFIAKIMQLQVQVTVLVMNIDHIIPPGCNTPCNIKANDPIAIIRNVGRAIPSVLRVRMVVIACGR